MGTEPAMGVSGIPEDQRASSAPDLRKLAHELRNHLFTLSLAVKSLELARDDAERFARLLERVRSGPLNGIEDVARVLEGSASDER